MEYYAIFTDTSSDVAWLCTRPFNAESDWRTHSPSALVEKCVDLGGSPRATIAWGRLVKVWALLMHQRAEVYPEDVQALARYIHQQTR